MLDLKNSLSKAIEKGIKPRAIVVINPGNPTGSVLTRENIHDIIKFAYENKLVILADEVYQNNIHTKHKEFISMKEVLYDSNLEIKNSVELFSFISVSKGILGECGLRGGAMEIINIEPKVKETILKLLSIGIAPNTLGQLAIDLLVDPPKQEDLEIETWSNYKLEIDHLTESLAKRARMVSDSFNKMKNIECNEVHGAMFAFAKINFSDKALGAAEKEGKKPDVYYCFKLLEETGIVSVPGSGFQQEPGTYHIRLATLSYPDESMELVMRKLHRFNEKFHEEYQDDVSI